MIYIIRILFEDEKCSVDLKAEAKDLPQLMIRILKSLSNIDF